MTARRTQIITLFITSAIGLIGAYAYLNSRGPGDSVELVDVRADIEQDFIDRSEALKNSVTTADSTGTRMVGKYDYGALSEELARKMFPVIKAPNRRRAYDPYTFYWGVPGFRTQAKGRGLSKEGYLMVNNSMGFRRESEVMSSQPDLRILVTGDSHTEGVVPMPDHFTEVLEASLKGQDPDRTVEVLNGGAGGYSFFHYLGVAAKFKDLKPDYFVVAVYGGNDFRGVLRLYRYFYGIKLAGSLPKKHKNKSKKLREKKSQLFGQFFNQALTMSLQPKERELIEKATLELVAELQSYCESIDTKLVIMYVPPLFDVQPQFAEKDIQWALDLFDFTPEDLGHTDLLADRLLEQARESGVPCVDLRAAYRQSDQFVYWGSDHHINVEGHAIAAQELEKTIQQLLNQ